MPAACQKYRVIQAYKRLQGMTQKMKLIGKRARLGTFCRANVRQTLDDPND
jgi:hypothetical protein